ARQRSLLDRKLQNVPERHVPKITIHDILYPTPRVLHITTLPSDLQLPYFLRNRALINHDSERPIKDERRQPLKLTRAIFFYHLSEAHQFQRFHDMARWNIAMFTALLTLSSPTIPSTPTAKPTPTSSSDTITPAAHRFITIYLSAVLERHNTPTLFTAREAFIKRWKTSPLDLFTNIKASQRKLLKKALARLNTEWERELDIAVRTMDRKEYDARVAPFVGSVIPGRKDQGLMPVPEATRDFTRSAGPSPEAEHEVAQGGNEILDALCVPLDDGMYRDEKRYEEDVSTPVDIRVAIATVQRAVPRDVLRALMRAF
ncbi:hypothetical protein CC86DRAFT_271693, partial [Ophiobolus disseminans]